MKSFDHTDEKWAELHGELQDMLAGYIDNELEDAETSIIESHLVGCEACRNDVQRQQLLCDRLESIPSPRMKLELHHRIDKELAETEVLNAPKTTKPRWSPANAFAQYMRNHRMPVLVGMGGWVMAALFAVLLITPVMQKEMNNGIPMIQDALAEYYEIEKSTLPVVQERSKNKAPVNWEGAHLLAVWSTEVAGAPAKAYALRSGDDIIFQYHIDEVVFFRNPVVRAAISENGIYQAQDKQTDIMALPLTNSGVLVIGPEHTLPATEHLIINSI